MFFADFMLPRIVRSGQSPKKTAEKRLPRKSIARDNNTPITQFH